ncbi:MAG: helix-turn-helix transcriptional regulator [Pirellulaceae bacterium]
MAKSNRSEPSPPRRNHPEIWALLTEREAEILTPYLVHPNDKKIARLLNTTPSTIRTHLTAIEKKAGVGSRNELLVFFLSSEGDKST